jgi:hypothetical protein
MSDKHQPIVIDTPHVPPAEAGPRDAESRAVASRPEFQALIAEGRRNRAARKGLSAAEVFDGTAGDADGTAPQGVSANGRPAKERARTRAVGR